jgi:osmotically-inducible protein OsmY
MNRVFLSLVAGGLLVSSCSPVGVATGVGAAVGVAAVQEGGLNQAGTDLRIRVEINDAWFKYDFEAFRKLDMTVKQGRVLLTGVVQNPEHRVEAVRLAWQPAGVKQVINEIRVAESTGITGYARDTWITTRLRTELTFDRNVQSINYTIDTVQGTVYLMGIAQNQAELNKVIERARTIPDVKQVVSYVKLAGEQIDTYQPDNSGQAQQGQSYQQQDSQGASPYNSSYDRYGNDYSAPESAGPIQITPVDVQPLR